MKKILISLDGETMALVNQVSLITFSSLDDDGDVAVIFDHNIEDINKIIQKKIPLVLIAGLINTKEADTKVKYALKQGIIAESIMLKTKEGIQNVKGDTFDVSAEGLDIDDMIMLCEYAFRKALIPEKIFLWKAPEKQNEIKESLKKSPTQIVTGEMQIISNNQIKLVQENNEHKAKDEKKATIKQEKLEVFLNKAQKKILIIKTEEDINCKDIDKLGGVHLEIGLNPDSYVHYHEDKNQAVLNGKYAYGLENVCYSFIGDKLIIEVSLNEDTIPLLEILYNSADIVVQAPKSFTSGNDAIKDWINSKYRLNAIAVQNDYDLFKKEHGDLVVKFSELTNVIR